MAHQIVLKITGVTCNSCVQRIKSSLEEKYPLSIDHNAINVDLETKVFVFKILDNFVTADELMKSIESIDSKYNCSLIMENIDSIDQYDNNTQKIPLLGNKNNIVQSAKKNIDLQKPGESVRKCYISISGMTCTSCVDKIEKRLSSIPGIMNIQIGLIAARGEVDFDSSVIKPEAIVDILEDMGYEASLISVIDSKQQTELKLEIIGITSQENINTIKSTIGEMIGVASIQIVPETSLSTIVYYHDLIGPRRIADAIQNLGFSVFAYNSFNPKAFVETIVQEINKWKKSFFISLIFGVPTVLSMIYFMYVMPRIYIDEDLKNHRCCVVPGLSLENLILFVLSTPVQIFGAKYFYIQVIFNIDSVQNLAFLLYLIQ